MLSSNFNVDNRCSSIREGNTVNVHVTATGALIAIGLIFLRSNNHEIAAKIAIPNSKKIKK
jgi:anaphase-promoting complex subunit 1